METEDLLSSSIKNLKQNEDVHCMPNSGTFGLKIFKLQYIFDDFFIGLSTVEIICNKPIIYSHLTLA